METLLFLKMLASKWKFLLGGSFIVYSGVVTGLYLNTSKRLGAIEEVYEARINRIEKNCQVDKLTLKTKYENREREAELEALVQYKKGVEEATETERTRYEKTIQALRNSQQREKQIANDLATTNTLNNRLHDTIRDLETRVSENSREAESRLRLAQQVSFQECTDRLTEVESDANRLASKLKEFDESWPTSKEEVETNE